MRLGQRLDVVRMHQEPFPRASRFLGDGAAQGEDLAPPAAGNVDAGDVRHRYGFIIVVDEVYGDVVEGDDPAHFIGEAFIDILDGQGGADDAPDLRHGGLFLHRAAGMPAPARDLCVLHTRLPLIDRKFRRLVTHGNSLIPKCSVNSPCNQINGGVSTRCSAAF